MRKQIKLFLGVALVCFVAIVVYKLVVQSTEVDNTEDRYRGNIESEQGVQITQSNKQVNSDAVVEAEKKNELQNNTIRKKTKSHRCPIKIS